jgi:tetratricopeptide (TPR) repeat protein
LALLPGFHLAHWLAATVHVARNVLDEAERELRAGIAVQDAQAAASRFNAVALHWLLGLVLLARGEEDAALAEFHRELDGEKSGHLYARECCANTWYAIGALQLRHKRSDDARHAFEEALSRVPNHGLTLAVLTAGSMSREPRVESATPSAIQASFETLMGTGIARALLGRSAFAAETIDRALASAPPGNAGWLIPVEPILQVSANPEAWAPVLDRLRSRAT